MLYAAGTIALVNASPAQACTGAGNNMPGGGSSTFGAFTLGTAYDAGNGFCFTLNSFAAGFTSSTSLLVNSTATTIGLSSSRPDPGFLGTNSLNYTFSRFLPDPSDLRLREYTGNVSTSSPPALNSTASMTFDPAIGSGPTIEALAFVFNNIVNVTTNPSHVYTYPYLRSETFAASMNVTEGYMTGFSSTTTWAPAPPAPGPLPLLGAGAAFGFSRKLRSRIKLSA